MTSEEFVLWLKGFTEGVHEYNITPKQWDLLKEKLVDVDDNKFVETPGMFQVHPQPPYPGAYPIGTPIGDGGLGIPNGTDTVTIGSSIGVTTINDPFKGTTTTFNPQSGSWHYTNSTDKTLLND